MQSPYSHPEVVWGFISAELKGGRIYGLIEQRLESAVHINRCGLVPKGHQPGQWRFIVDLSFTK